MKIGILGPGRVGASLAKLWALAGHEIMLGFSRDTAKLRSLADWVGHGAQPGSPAEVVRFADVILFSPPWWAAEEALASAGAMSGKILIDAVNPYAPGYQSRDPALPASVSAAERIADWAHDARTVKAFNTVPTAALTAMIEHLGEDAGIGLRQEDAFPIPPGAPALGSWPCLLCSDDQNALDPVELLIKQAGLVPVRAGSLRNAALIELGGPLYGHRFSTEVLKEELASLGVR
ncbi:NADPH-dependent F420 reductase [Bradyrhizobium elkanii]|uniref:NADPH-dependent F420 reductase n=1 Tax=Bradyrhizobium elkanii TaxID=29448 RepID=UPI00068467B9|nr:NAD(P)-binding domain-containing protein [Bradyrhizobium elkanii]WLA83284.1 NAD(P)-binding domain-containing protein [Bradyrhizobium elkanii]